MLVPRAPRLSPHVATCPPHVRLLPALVMAATVLCAAAQAAEHVGAHLDIGSDTLAQSLRRQLMKDNYDYMSPTESGEGDRRFVTDKQTSGDTVGEHTVMDGEEEEEEEEEEERNRTEARKYNKMTTETISDRRTLYSEVTNIDNDYEHIKRENLRKLTRKRKKLQKHMYDVNEDVAKRYRSRYRDKISDEDNSLTDHNAEITTTVKYKILKVLRNLYRRNNHADVLIQEESPHGVSIMNLGVGPFPEFRLPRGRRQYMKVPEALKAVGGDEEELPPPPVEESTHLDLNTDTEINNTKPIMLDVPNKMFNGGLNSLKITVTPEEILVL